MCIQKADPSKFEPQPMQLRRMTLPNPVIYKRFDSDEEDNSEGKDEEVSNEHIVSSNKRQLGVNDDSKATSEEGASPVSRMSKVHQDPLGFSQHNLPSDGTGLTTERSQSASSGSNMNNRMTTGRKSISPAQHSDLMSDGISRFTKLRKGSIAQVSLSGVMKLSHRLSVKRPKSSNRSGSKTGTRFPSLSRKSPTIVHYDDDKGSLNDENDPIRLGKQILDAYLIEQKKREELEAQRAKEEAEARREASSPNVDPNQAPRLHSQPKQSVSNNSNNNNIISSANLAQDPNQSSSGKQDKFSKGSNSRKSFKDFRNISKRIFSRHSSSKQLQSQQSDSFQGQQTSNTSSIPPSTADKNVIETKKGHDTKSRSVFKLKRSETVMETPGSPGTSAKNI